MLYQRMTSATSGPQSRIKLFRKSVSSIKMIRAVFACSLTLGFVGFYMSYNRSKPVQYYSQAIGCPIPYNSCIHLSADPLSLKDVCPGIRQTTAHCRDDLYDAIVTDKEFMEELSGKTNKLIVTGPSVGEYVDSFVQKDSRWIIDVVGGGKEFEVLTSVEDPERLALHKKLDQLQSKCERFFHGAIGIYGFGSNWHALGLGLAHTLYYNMTFYPFDEHKNFIGMTTCTEEQMQRAFAQTPPETDMHFWNASTTNFKSLSPDVHPLMLQKEIIDPDFEHKGHFWWRSMLTYYATRPNYKMRAEIRQKSMPTTPCISIHVRHSDKRTEAALLDFKHYMDAAIKYKSMTGISNIYLMSDDPSVIAETGSRKYEDFRFQYQDVKRTNQGWENDLIHGVSIDAQERNFLIDIHSAAQCQYNILTYSSNVGRLIAELAYGTRNKEPSVQSLDSEWIMYP